MTTKTYLIILGSSCALMIIGAIIGNILESSGTLSEEKIGTRGVKAVMFTYLALFCVMAFAIVPLAVRFFIVMQVKIGNGEFIVIKWLQAHEQSVVHGFWAMMVLGICMIYFLARDEVIKGFR